MNLTSIRICFFWQDELVYGTATPFQNEDCIFYDVAIPGKVFTIRPNETDYHRLKWTDLGGNESLLFTRAGEALEKITT